MGFKLPLACCLGTTKYKYGGQHIVDGPVGVDHLAGKTVGINGVAQLVGVGFAVFVDGQQVQFVLAFENGGIAAAHQQVKQKA